MRVNIMRKPAQQAGTAVETLSVTFSQSEWNKEQGQLSTVRRWNTLKGVEIMQQASGTQIKADAPKLT